MLIWSFSARKFSQKVINVLKYLNSEFCFLSVLSLKAKLHGQRSNSNVNNYWEARSFCFEEESGWVLESTVLSCHILLLISQRLPLSGQLGYFILSYNFFLWMFSESLRGIPSCKMAFAENWVVKVFLASKSHTCLTSNLWVKKTFSHLYINVKKHPEIQVCVGEIWSA